MIFQFFLIWLGVKQNMIHSFLSSLISLSSLVKLTIGEIYKQQNKWLRILAKPVSFVILH